jgi:hypothetical protein
LAEVVSKTDSTNSWTGGERHRLIGDQPVKPYALHRLAELTKADGLLDIAVRTQVVAGDQVPLLFRGGHIANGIGAGEIGGRDDQFVPAILISSRSLIPKSVCLVANQALNS